MIVSLLDLHVSPPSTSDYQDDHRLEILEAGTGHGALTLHLARAVHAANPPAAPPSALENVTDDAESLYTGVVRFLGLDKPAPLPTQESPHDQNPLSSLSQKENRRAIIHTLDISSRHSTHASAIVRNFRHGIYANNVDFHVGDVSEWIVEQQSLRRKGTTDTSNSTPTDDPQRFLSHIILDLPNTHSHLASAASALQTDGILTVFNPSITQITACVDLIRRQKLPLLLEQVVELGAGSTGGREWDVRAVRPRALERGWKDRKDGSMATRMEGEQKDGNASTSGSDTESNAPANVEEEQIIQEAKPDPSNVMRVGEEKSRDDEQAQAQSQCQKQPQGRDKQSDEDSGYEMVCRPKVGGRVVGGGFLGVWRRMRDTREGQTE
ncbi:MAG: hypothetical protein M1827_000988 [Pycnora praestabilis]|nr:MAG: hypothetical protein M1827_000988 [Pycnora praestabilis]